MQRLLPLLSTPQQLVLSACRNMRQAHLTRVAPLSQMIKGPVTKHLPLGAHRLGFSHAATKRVPMYDFVKDLDDSKPIVFVVSLCMHAWHACLLTLLL